MTAAGWVNLNQSKDVDDAAASEAPLPEGYRPLFEGAFLGTGCRSRSTYTVLVEKSGAMRVFGQIVKDDHVRLAGAWVTADPFPA